MHREKTYQPSEGSAAHAMLFWMQIVRGRDESGFSSADLAEAGGVPPKQVVSIMAGCVRAGLAHRTVAGGQSRWHLGAARANQPTPAPTWAAARRVPKPTPPAPGPTDDDIARTAISRAGGGVWWIPNAPRSVFEIGVRQ